MNGQAYPDLMRYRYFSAECLGISTYVYYTYRYATNVVEFQVSHHSRKKKMFLYMLFAKNRFVAKFLTLRFRIGPYKFPVGRFVWVRRSH